LLQKSIATQRFGLNPAIAGSKRGDNELSKKAMAREEYTSAMARRASNFGYDSAKPEGTVRQRGSLRAGAPSRIRSRSSPADAALDRRRRCG